jgi:hypothetical protein
MSYSVLLLFKQKMVRHGGCLGLGLAAMGTAKQGMGTYWICTYFL